MFRLAIKNLATNKIRLGLTALAIVLGVGFVVSSFILRDGLKDTFGSLSDAVVEGIDLAVELDPDIPGATRLTSADIETVQNIPGVRIAEGDLEGIENLIQPILDDGTTITLNGPPQLMLNWTVDEGLSPSELLSGRAPTGPDEWVVDIDSAEEHNFVLDTTYDIITPSGRKTASLVGIFAFEGSDVGATFMAMETSALRDYALLDDTWDQIQIAADGSVPLPEIQTAIDTALNTSSQRVVVLDQAGLADNQQAEFNEALDIIGGILLGFALVALFVSIFIIANTFSITTSQRTRELGLLRAIGATPGQVLRSVVSESVVIGLVASAVGIIAGIGLAYGTRGLLNLVGAEIPSFDLILTTTTIVFAFLVGTIVTVLSALFPALTASRTSPIAAITGHSDTAQKSKARFVIGALIAALGAALMAQGLFGGADSVIGVLGPLGSGAALLFIGITLLSPLVAGPLSHVLGTPIAAVYKTPGRLSRENASRNPRRTATTAAALMIGLSLVSMAFVLGDSFKAEFDKILDTSVQADYLVTSDLADIPDEVATQLADDPAFDRVSAVKYWDAFFDNTPVDGVPVGQDAAYEADVAAFDYSVIDSLFNLDVTEGSLAAVNNNTTAVRDAVVEDLGVGIGDSLTMRLEDGTTADLEIVAVFEESQVSNPVLISFDRFDQVSTQLTSDWVAATVAPDVDITTADARFRELAAQYPNLAFDSSAEFRESFAGQIDSLLNILTGLLGLTIFIALLGIANTLALSVFERTREIGLLRAVGMTRRQTRRMIRWEAAIISAVGALLGAVLGVGLGIVMVNAIPGDFITSFAVPWIRIIVMVVIASLAGLLAALFPAFRASRMNVLDAISHS